MRELHSSFCFCLRLHAPSLIASTGCSLRRSSRSTCAELGSPLTCSCRPLPLLLVMRGVPRVDAISCKFYFVFIACNLFAGTVYYFLLPETCFPVSWKGCRQV